MTLGSVLGEGWSALRPSIAVSNTMNRGRFSASTAASASWGQNSKSGTFHQRSGLDPLVAFGLAGALIFFLISGLVAYRNVETLRDNYRQAGHSQEVMSTLNQLLSSLQDAETGQRGFLLTNIDRYLEPYNAALRPLANGWMSSLN